jgi:hypothetical protein
MRIQSPRGRLACLVVLTLAGAAANAASVSYFIDQTNGGPQLANDVNYLQVTVSDAAFGADANAIRFDVTILPALTGIADSNFGIQSFGFNTSLATPTVLGAIAGLPSGWSTDSDSNQGPFGNFELAVSGTGGNRQDPTLTFYVTGIAGDLVTDYAALSNGNAGAGNEFFAGHVAGFLDQDPGAGELTSAYFGGSQAVPVPATAWLFMTGIVALAGRARRRFSRR